MNRKEFISSVAAATGAMALSGVNGKVEAAEKSRKTKEDRALDKLTERRHEARWRIRRVICNNDGNDDICSADEVITRELFLAKRTTGLVGTHVDTICYCGGVTFSSNGAKDPNRFVQPRLGKERFAKDMDAQGFDPMEVQLNFCHQHGIEFFWSHRINDNHDRRHSKLLTPFKKEHPELLVGRDGPLKKKIGDTCFDYTLPQVRAKSVETVLDMASIYDLDGIELDFFRHPAYFRSQFMGQEVSEEETEMMTEMVREIRRGLDAEGMRRGRPILLCVCVPDSVGFSRAIGLDWPKWAREDLIDILVGADYLKFEPWANFAALARELKLPCYARMEQRRLVLMDDSLSSQSKPEAKLTDETEQLWLDEAYAAWVSGVNGIYTYNRFDPMSDLFRTLGDPYRLAAMGAKPRESYGIARSGYNCPEFWLDNGSQFLRIPKEPHYDLPCRFPGSDSVAAK